MKDITRWLYITDLDHLTVREWINGLWFAVSFAMCFEFGLRLAARVREFGTQFRSDVGARAILALFAYFLGESLIRGWVWLILALQNAGSPWVLRVQADYYIALLAAGISTWAALCCLYVLSENHWAWVRAAVIIVVFVMMATVIQLRLIH